VNFGILQIQYWEIFSLVHFFFPGYRNKSFRPNAGKTFVDPFGDAGCRGAVDCPGPEQGPGHRLKQRGRNPLSENIPHTNAKSIFDDKEEIVKIPANLRSWVKFGIDG
jgi:hypothetical protein